AAGAGGRAGRARRGGGGPPTAPGADLTRQREAVDAFLAAARDGDFVALLAVLDPDVVVRADRGAVPAGASREVRGAKAVAEQALAFSRLVASARPVLVNGAAGRRVWGPRGGGVFCLGVSGPRRGGGSHLPPPPRPPPPAPAPPCRSSTTDADDRPHEEPAIISPNRPLPPAAAAVRVSRKSPCHSAAAAAVRGRSAVDVGECGWTRRSVASW